MIAYICGMFPQGHHLTQKRVKDVELVVPIAYGTISFWLGKRATETKAYQWAVYVRAANNEDLSGVIKKVVFSLHPSFENPTRGEGFLFRSSATSSFSLTKVHEPAVVRL